RLLPTIVDIVCVVIIYSKVDVGILLYNSNQNLLRGVFMNNITKSEAIKEVNNGKTIITKANDGHIEVRQLQKSLYELRVFEGNEELEVLRGDFKALTKTLNKAEGLS